MSRSLALGLCLALLSACTDDDPDAATVSAALEAPGLTVLDLERTQLAGDVYHHAFTLRLGASANARIRLHRVVRERAPWLPRHTRAGAMLLHGDFSSFAGNFAPTVRNPDNDALGMAVWLAQHDLDVWGFDRRWAVAEADESEADLADLAGMGFAQEIDDTTRALTAARAVRAATGSGLDRMHLVGFSRGGFLAYAAAAADAARPALLRNVKGLVPLDVWAVIPPEDTAGRARVCESAFYERLDLDAGVVDSPNDFFIKLGARALSDPDAPTPVPFLAGFTNREAFLFSAAQTYNFFAPTDHYHLAAADLVDDVPAGLSESPEPVIAQWFAGAVPHQSLREATETDEIWCGDGSGPFTVDLARIRVPVYYVGAAGGYGDHGLYSLTRVSSSDVSSNVVRRFGPEGAFEDFGHGDLLFADDAPTLVWQPLARWLANH